MGGGSYVALKNFLMSAIIYIFILSLLLLLLLHHLDSVSYTWAGILEVEFIVGGVFIFIFYQKVNTVFFGL